MLGWMIPLPACPKIVFSLRICLKSAYRSMKISKNSQNLSGLHWNFGGRTVYMRDTKLRFGARLSPAIFHRITEAVKRMMARRGFENIIVYLEEKCVEVLNCLILLLRKLFF